MDKVQFQSKSSGLWHTNPLEAGEISAIMLGKRGRHLKFPDGAILVNGPMRRGDLVANLYSIKWEPIDADDEGIDASIYCYVCRPMTYIDF